MECSSHYENDVVTPETVDGLSEPDVFSADQIAPETDGGVCINTTAEIADCPKPEVVSQDKFNKGDIIDVGNGVRVEIADTFVPTNDCPEAGFACVNFYIGEQKINAEQICLQPQDTFFCPGPGKLNDYGVEIRYWPMERNGIRMALTPRTNLLFSSINLYLECLKADGAETACLTKYVQHTGFDLETNLKLNDANINEHTIFPKDRVETGVHLSDELTACRNLVGNITGEPLQDITLRYYVSDGKFQNKPIEGRSGYAASSESNVIFADPKTADNLTLDIAKYSSEPDSKCHDGMVLHELAHSTWDQNNGMQFFWMPLQEGAARFIELNYPEEMAIRPELFEINEDVSEGTSFYFNRTYGDTSEDITLKITSIEEDKISGTIETLAVVQGHTFNDKYDFSLPTGEISKINIGVEFSSDSFLVSYPKTIDGNKMVKLMMLSVEDQPDVAEHNRLVCGESSYTFDYGLWIDGEFYKYAAAEAFDANGTYQSLDKFDPKKYNTGACFFDGIRVMYENAGVDFSTFFKKLSRAVVDHNESPISHKVAEKFCALSEIQSILDEAIPNGTPDIFMYAHDHFHYEGEPWCKGVKFASGDQFGRYLDKE